MSTTSQNERGPAETAISPSHCSTNPHKEIEMNMHSNNTGQAAEATVPRSHKLSLLRALDILSEVDDYLQAAFMAAGDIDDTRKLNAIQRVIDRGQDSVTRAKVLINDVREAV